MTSTNMRPVDRIAEKLKNDAIGEFFTEEDLLKLSQQALELAFFTGTPGTYNRDGQPPLIVKLAKEHLSEKIKTWIEEMWPKIVNDEKFQEKMGQIMIASLGDSLMSGLRMQWQSHFQEDIHKFGPIIANIVKQNM